MRDLDQEQDAKRQKLPQGQNGQVVWRTLQALPGHSLLLGTASTYLDAQLGKIQGHGRPSVPVVLGAQEDLPAARAAIQFAYTSQLPDSISSCKQLVQVRRIASDLVLEGCIAACDRQLLSWLEAPGGGDTALQLCACLGQLPIHLGHSPSGDLATVWDAAKQQLLKHFKDAPAVLRQPGLEEQLCSLPAVALHALLACDAFGTQSEASVLLLLARWRDANPAVAKPALDRLCSHVRLLHLCDAYLHGVLPHLGWFPISREEHLFLLQYKASSHREQLAIAAAGAYAMGKPWYGRPRAAAPPRKGLTVNWSVPVAALARLMQRAAAASDCDDPSSDGDGEEDIADADPRCAYAFASFALEGGDGGGGSHTAGGVCMHGWEWRVALTLQHGASAAGLYLCCIPPSPFQELDPIGVVPLAARLAVFRGKGKARQEAHALECRPEEPFIVRRSQGDAGALPLARPRPRARPVPAGSGGSGDGEVVDEKYAAEVRAEYVRNGVVSGSLTFKPA